MTRQSIVMLVLDEDTGQVVVMDAAGKCHLATTPEQLGLACLVVLRDPDLPQASQAPVDEVQEPAPAPPPPPKGSRPKPPSFDLDMGVAVMDAAIAKIRRLGSDFSAALAPAPVPKKRRAAANKKQAARATEKPNRKAALASRRRPT